MFGGVEHLWVDKELVEVDVHDLISAGRGFNLMRSTI